MCRVVYKDACLIRLRMYVLDTTPMPCFLNKIKSIMTQDFKMNKQLWDSRVYETRNKILIFFIPDMGRFCQKRVHWTCKVVGFKRDRCDSLTTWKSNHWRILIWSILFKVKLGISLWWDHDRFKINKTLKLILSWSDAFQWVQCVNP